MYEVDKATHNWLALQTGNTVFRRHAALLKGTVADLGCGRSPFKEDILQAADRYIGVDWENSMHDQHNVDVFSNLNRKLELPDVSVDSAMAFHVMEHLCEPERFLNEVYRILKPGSFFLIAVPFNWHLHEIPHDHFRYTPYCLEYLLNKCGFTNIKVSLEGGFFTTVTLKCNYALRRILRGPLRYFGIPFWYVNQYVAACLDKRFPCPPECTAITVVAEKPCEL